MAWLTDLLDGSNLSGDMFARLAGAGGGSLGNIWDAPVAPGVGTGYTVGVVGKMNGAAGADPNHFAVIADGTDRILTVRPGWVWVRRDAGATTLDPRCILVELTAPLTVTIAANAQGTTRVDTVYLRVNIAGVPDATGSNIPSLSAVTGGASSALGNAPSDGALYVPLANVTVANAAASLTQSTIADKRYVHPTQAKARAWLSAAQSIASGTATAINLDTASFDPAGVMTLGAGAHILVPTSGYYRLNFGILWNAATANQAYSIAYRNAGAGYSELARGVQSLLLAVGNLNTLGGDLVHLNAGDLLQLWAFQASGGNLSPFAGGSGAWNFLSLDFSSF